MSRKKAERELGAEGDALALKELANVTAARSLSDQYLDALRATAAHIFHIGCNGPPNDPTEEAFATAKDAVEELVAVRGVLHELLPYCKTHVQQESFRDAINRAEALLKPKTKGGRTP